MEKGEGVIQLSIGAGPRAHLRSDMSGPEMAKTLRKVYESESHYIERGKAWRTITRTKLSEYGSVAEYGDAIREARGRLVELGIDFLKDWMVTSSFLGGLGEGYQGLVAVVVREAETVKFDLEDVVRRAIGYGTQRQERRYRWVPAGLAVRTMVMALSVLFACHGPLMSFPSSGVMYITYLTRVRWTCRWMGILLVVFRSGCSSTCRKRLGNPRSMRN